MVEKHTILGGKVHLYQRNESPKWHCSAFLAGKNHRKSTKETSLSKAKDVAEDWFFDLRDKEKRGEIIGERVFADAAERFMHEYEVLTEGERNPRWVKDHYRRIKMHLNPFFGKMGLSQITSGTVQDYRISRTQGEGGKKPPSRSTLHHEIVTLRQVLKTAAR